MYLPNTWVFTTDRQLMEVLGNLFNGFPMLFSNTLSIKVGVGQYIENIPSSGHRAVRANVEVIENGY